MRTMLARISFACGISFAAALLSLITTTLSAQDPGREKPRLAIMDLEPGPEVNESLASLASDLIRTGMVKSGLFQVIDRKSIQSVLKEQAFQQTGCTDTTCAVRVGQLLAANKMLTGTIKKIGSRIIINANIIDVEKGTIEFAEKGSADDLGKLEEASDDFARKIAARIAGISEEDIAGARKPRGPAILRSALIPGWGQYREGQTAAGAVYFFAAVAALGNYASAYSHFQSAKKDYNGMQIPSYLIGNSLLTTAVQSQLPSTQTSGAAFGYSAGFIYRDILLASSRNSYQKAHSNLGQAAGILAGVWLIGLVDAFFQPNAIKSFFIPTSQSGARGTPIVALVPSPNDKNSRYWIIGWAQQW